MKKTKEKPVLSKASRDRSLGFTAIHGRGKVFPIRIGEGIVKRKGAAFDRAEELFRSSSGNSTK